MGEQVRARLRSVRVRQRSAQAIRFAAVGLAAGSAAALILAAINLGWREVSAVWAPFAIALVCSSAAAVIGLALPRAWREAASAVDRHYRLKDRAATALDLADRSEVSSAGALALDDALVHLQTVNSREVVSIRPPRAFAYGIGALAAAAVLVTITVFNRPAIALPTGPLDLAVRQAERIDEELTALEEFAEEHKDPEIEKLVKEIQKLTEELKQPGVDERETLAKLSEMQAVLENQQAKTNVAAVDAHLKAVGEALALATPLADAGQALSTGQFEKAAEQLENQELPKLDRQTEKALKEKLDQLAKRMSESGQSSLGEAVGKISECLGSDANGFREGSKKLASECRGQSTRKKLNDLLQKQCNCLSECKSECEGECQNKALVKSNKKGGKKWGLGQSDGAPGESTLALGGKKLEKIKGQHSSEGDVEVETTTTPDAKQQAQREYRQNYSKYKKISESVLESEPIPLGHRQTIRRYFESIRPDHDETDAVTEATK